MSVPNGCEQTLAFRNTRASGEAAGERASHATKLSKPARRSLGRKRKKNTFGTRELRGGEGGSLATGALIAEKRALKRTRST